MTIIRSSDSDFLAQWNQLITWTSHKYPWSWFSLWNNGAAPHGTHRHCDNITSVFWHVKPHEACLTSKNMSKFSLISLHDQSPSSQSTAYGWRAHFHPTLAWMQQQHPILSRDSPRGLANQCRHLKAVCPQRTQKKCEHGPSTLDCIQQLGQACKGRMTNRGWIGWMSFSSSVWTF